VTQQHFFSPSRRPSERQHVDCKDRARIELWMHAPTRFFLLGLIHVLSSRPDSTHIYIRDVPRTPASSPQRNSNMLAPRLASIIKWSVCPTVSSSIPQSTNGARPLPQRLSCDLPHALASQSIPQGWDDPRQKYKCTICSSDGSRYKGDSRPSFTWRFTGGGIGKMHDYTS